MKKILLALLLLFYSKEIIAEDLGVHGNLFPITEPDMLFVIKNKLKKMSLDGSLQYLNNQIKKRAISNIEHPKKVANIQTATSYRRYIYDPTIIISQDLKDNKGKIFYKKGTKVNPLDHIDFKQKLYFIDGSDKEQIEWVLSSYRNYFDKIILVNGSPLNLMRKYKIRFYFDQQSILTNKFSIQNVPALLQKSKDNMLIIEEFVL